MLPAWKFAWWELTIDYKQREKRRSRQSYWRDACGQLNIDISSCIEPEGKYCGIDEY